MKGNVVRHCAFCLLLLLLVACPQVPPPPDPGVDSVTVSPDEVSLITEEQRTLTASVEGKDAPTTVTWQSSDDSIVAVDEEGRVTAVAPGEATVTAVSTADNTKSGAASVRVVNSEPNNTSAEATPITLNFDSPQLEISAGDVDWYSFTLSQAALISADINASVLGSSLDAVIGLFAEDETLLRQHDDGATADPYLERVLTAGTYYLAVSSSGDSEFKGEHSGAGYYYLRVDASLPPNAVVTPDTLALSALGGETATASFTLTNTGSAPLTYSAQDGEPGFSPAAEPALSAASVSRWQSRFARTGKRLPRAEREQRDLAPIITDPVGDTFAEGPDILSVNAETAEGTLTLAFTSAPSTFDGADFAGIYEFDMDQNPFTGNLAFGACSGQLIGPELYLSITDATEAVLENASGQPIASYPLKTVGEEDKVSGLSVSLPLTALGDDADFDLTFTAGTLDEPSDCVPDKGNATVGTPAEVDDPITVAPGSGTLEPGASAELNVSVETAGLTGRNFPWQVLLTTDGPLTPELRVDLEVLVSDPGEPNETPEQATAAEPPYQSPELLMIPGDVDWYSFSLSGKSLLSAVVATSSLDLLSAVFDEGLNPVLEDDAPGGSLLEGVLEPGQYFLAVTGNPDFDLTGEHAQNGVYRLELTTGPIPSGSVAGRVLTPYEPLGAQRLADSLGVRRDASYVPGEVLVKFAGGVRTQSVRVQNERRTALAELGLRAEREVGDALLVRVAGIRSASAEGTLRSIAELRSRPDVVYAEPNYIRTASAAPNDPLYPKQWHYNLINLEKAWDISTGSAEVTVAVLDSGVASKHPDLNCGRTLPGYDFFAYDSNPEDEGPDGGSGYHGTHVLGTVGACSNNERGVSGVDWRAQLMSVRVLGPDSGNDADIASGILWAAGLDVVGVPTNPNPADVINMSLGGPGYSQTLQDAVSEAAAAGAIIVVAAGNNSDRAEDYSPAGLSDLITVGAVSPDSNLAWYSNYGSSLEIMAPGGAMEVGLPDDDVLSTISSDKDEFDYSFASGTSMAAPHVSGVVALMKAVKPDLDLRSATAYLQNTATPLARDCADLGCGAGLVNAAAAVEAASTGAPIGALLAADAQPDFGLEATKASFSLQNVGDKATSVTLNSSNGALTLSPKTAQLAPGASVKIDLTLNRGNLDSGAYTVSLSAAYGDAALTVPTFFRVGRGSADIGPLTVRLLRLVDENSSVVAEKTARFGGGYSFSFSELPAGSYAVFAFDEPFEAQGTAFVELKEGEDLKGTEVQLERTSDLPNRTLERALEEHFRR